MRPEQVKCNTPGSSGTVGQEAARAYRHGRETVEFSVKGPVGVSLNDDNVSNSGCAVLDLMFTVPSQVGEITFRNYYTMWLSVLVKIKMKQTENEELSKIAGDCDYTKSDSVTDWIKSIPRKVIMPYPHYETGSQDIVCISASESIVEWKNLVAMRLILRQPSPVWKTFHIEEINVFKDLPRRANNKESPAESLILLIKKQTIASLKYNPNSQNSHQECTGSYEFSNLPQP